LGEGAGTWIELTNTGTTGMSAFDLENRTQPTNVWSLAPRLTYNDIVPKNSRM